MSVQEIYFDTNIEEAFDMANQIYLDEVTNFVPDEAEADDGGGLGVYYCPDKNCENSRPNSELKP